MAANSSTPLNSYFGCSSRAKQVAVVVRLAVVKSPASR
jgi:hypothetical protein